jgi:uncharacterized protein YjbI with pentapeptide repeats
LVGVGANFEQSRIEQSRFVGANLEGASFTAARLTGVDFSGARIDGANLRAARLFGVNLASASLTSVDMRGRGLRLRHALSGRLRSAAAPARAERPLLFPGGPLPRFDGADLTRALADFSDRICVAHRFEGRGLPRCGSRVRISRGLTFSESSGGDNFTGANLTNANFSGARGLGSFTSVGRGQPRRSSTAPSSAGCAFEPRLFLAAQDGFISADVTRANLEGAILLCANLVQNHPPSAPWRERQIAWIRDLEPRRRGIILDDSCLQVPGLAGVR